MVDQLEIAQTPYDVVPYASFSFSQTHPDRLATIATLLGMEPPDIRHCRVLELGCAGGGNLTPMAQSLPESDFVGLDFSARQIAEGQAGLAELGLKNIRLEHKDILAVTVEFGQFDYIIAHGVYSWVPPAVQDKVLEICARNLAPNGVAYISYNTYPGWRLHSAIRDMMLYHTRQVDDPTERIVQARELLDFLTESVLAGSSSQASFLHSYVSYVKERFLPAGDDAYLFHNELAEFNEPLYFHQFVERAGRHGLKYLAEAEFQTMLAGNLPDKVAVALRRMAKDTIALEQYMDFLRNRIFRQTLLCHQAAPLSGRVTPERLSKFYLASAALPETSDLDPRSTGVDRFRAPNGDTFSTDHPPTKAAMLHLSQVWPQAVPFDRLLPEAYARLNGTAAQAMSEAAAGRDQQILGANLLKAYSYNDDLVEFHVYQPPFVTTVSERPVVSPVARMQSKQGRRVTNLRHELIDLEGLNYFLMPYLDGSWSQAALIDLLAEAVAEGTLELQQGDEPLLEARQVKEALPGMLAATLRALANATLLVG